MPPMLTQVDALIHRDYAALIAAVPALAAGSLAAFAARDRADKHARRHAAAEEALGAAALAHAAEAGDPEAAADALLAGLAAAFGHRATTGAGCAAAAELALIGVVLAAMAERLEHDPVSYPQLAHAAARLVPAAGVADRAASRPDPGWTGLTERARRAAVDVLRPAALSTLVRAATWSLALPAEVLA